MSQDWQPPQYPQGPPGPPLGPPQGPPPGYGPPPGPPQQFGPPGLYPGYGPPPARPNRTPLIALVVVLLIAGLGVGLYFGLKGGGGGSSNASSTSSSTTGSGGGGAFGGGGNAGSPANAVDTFMKAAQSGNVDQARTVICAKYRSKLPAGPTDTPDDTFATYTIGDTTQNGAEWIVDVDTKDSTGSDAGYKFHVVKEDGSYKVCGQDGPYGG